jgi:ribokinase
MSNIEVVGLGAINTDFLYLVKEVVLDGEGPVDRVKAVPGGSAANTIYGLARLGIKTGFLGAVGDDEPGRACLKDFQQAGVDASQVRVKKGQETGLALCLSDRAGKRSIYLSPGANSLLEPEDIDRDYLGRAKMVHLSSFVDDKQFDLQAELVAKLPPEVKISLAPGMLYAARGMKALSPLLKRSALLFINKDEIEKLTGEDYAAGAKECLSQGCQIVVVTLGKGAKQARSGRVLTAYIRDRNGEYRVEPSLSPPDHPETTGAGDAFAAGFLFGLLKGKKLEDCGRLGDTLACCALSKIGAREGLPTLPALRKMLPGIIDF